MKLQPLLPADRAVAAYNMRRVDMPRSQMTRFALTGLLAAMVCIAATSFIHTHSQESFADIDACTTGCEVAVAGYPWPYLVDYPGISPVGDPSVIDVMLASDQLLTGPLFADLAVWWGLCMAGTMLLQRVRNP